MLKTPETGGRDGRRFAIELSDSDQRLVRMRLEINFEIQSSVVPHQAIDKPYRCRYSAPPAVGYILAAKRSLDCIGST